MNVKPNDLEIIEDCIFEVIVSSYGLDNKPNAAPAGIIYKGSDKFHLFSYKGSRTLNNLTNLKCGVVNITFDARLFYRTAFKEANPNGKLPTSLFEKSKKINAPIIASTNFNLEFLVERIEEGDDKTLFNCRIISFKKNVSKTVPYTRGLFATIESIIHATRIRVFLIEGKNKEAGELIELVRYYRELIKRVSPNSDYLEIVEELLNKFDLWRKNSASNRQNSV